MNKIRNRRKRRIMMRRLKYAFFTALAIAILWIFPIRLCTDASPKVIESTEAEIIVDEPIEEVIEVVETEPEETIPYYTVNGEFIGYKLSDYLYEQLESRGAEDFYKVALCQLYQESRYNPNAVGYDGYDQGIAQIRVVFWDYFMEQAGLTSADPFNPIDSLYIYSYLMSTYIDDLDGDVNRALSKYNVGNTKWYNEEYVNAVMQWYDTIEEK